MSAGVSTSSSVWGTVDGQEVHRIVLDTTEGFSVSFATYGATLLSVRSGDKDGKIEEVSLQYDDLEGVVAGNAYYGSTVGRVCNRIARGRFSVDGEEFSLDANNGPNCLHSGRTGFDKAVWRHELVADGVRFEHCSPHGEGGFPGALEVKVTYSLKRGDGPGTGELHTKMEATYVAGSTASGKKEVPTPVNLTNHAYWNLSGNRKRSVRDHVLTMRCDRFLPLDANQIPTGELAPVRGTFFDFSEEVSVGAAIDGIGGDPPGLDHCLVRNGTLDDGQAERATVSEEEGDALPMIARLREPESGRTLEVFGSQPSVQVYTANFLSADPDDKPHARHYGLCLETQHFPDAVNRREWANSVLLQPGATYLERAKHVFTAVSER